MATLPDRFKLRISKYGFEALILLWPPPVQLQVNELDQSTTPIEEPLANFNDCLRYINQSKACRRLFVITCDTVHLSAERRIGILRSIVRQWDRDIRLVIHVLDQSNAARATDETAQYCNNARDLCIRLEEALPATNSSARSLAGSTTSLDSLSFSTFGSRNVERRKILIHWKRLLVRTLLELDQPRAEIERGLDRLQQYYVNDANTLRDIAYFRTEYFQANRTDGPICWFTKGNFLSKFLQQALETKNMEQLFQLRFFIRDLYEHLRSVQVEGSSHDNLTVYRSMLATTRDLPSADDLLTTDKFLSASTSYTIAEIFAEPTSVIYEIQTGLAADADFVYANLAQLSENTDASASSMSPDQQEVLFQLYASFRVREIHRDIQPTRVVLDLLGREEVDRMSNEIDEEFRNTLCDTENLLEPGRERQRRGEIARAVEYYQRLFTILLSVEAEPIETIMTQLQTLDSDEQGRSTKEAMILLTNRYR